MGFMKQFMQFINPSPLPKSQQTSSINIYNAIYPESIRYALQHNAARMGATEMRNLMHQWPFETLYLLVKALAPDRESQRAFLEDVTRLFVRPDWQRPALTVILEEYINLLPEDRTVGGAKLAQLNRVGGETWMGEFKKIALACQRENPDAMLALVAHTPLFAYNQFIEVYRGQEKPAVMHIVVPEWMMDPDEHRMGYKVTLSDSPKVEVQDMDRCLFESWKCHKHHCPLGHLHCSSVYFIDDTIHTSSTAGKLRNFWMSEYGLQIPNDHIRVITDLRNQNHLTPAG